MTMIIFWIGLSLHTIGALIAICVGICLPWQARTKNWLVLAGSVYALGFAFLLASSIARFAGVG